MGGLSETVLRLPFALILFRYRGQSAEPGSHTCTPSSRMLPSVIGGPVGAWDLSLQFRRIKQSIGLHYLLIPTLRVQRLVPFGQLQEPAIRHGVRYTFAGSFMAHDNHGQRAIRSVVCPDLQRALPNARLCRNCDAIGNAGTRSFVAVVVDDGDFARLGVEPLQRIEADADAHRNETAEPAVNASPERDPFLWRLGVPRHRDHQREDQCGSPCARGSSVGWVRDEASPLSHSLAQGDQHGALYRWMRGVLDLYPLAAASRAVAAIAPLGDDVL